MLSGMDPHRPLDALFVNSPLKDYAVTPRLNDFTLPVLGLAYIATYAQAQGFNVGVLDTEALGVGIQRAADIINAASPRWVGLNLLAPTYRHSTAILRAIEPGISVMLGGHQAKAMPTEILADDRIPRIDALILGEAEYRVAELLRDVARREALPGVWWRDPSGGIRQGQPAMPSEAAYWLSPDVNTLPFVDREFLSQDPFTADDGRVEANLVGSRGCPYDCSFCGAAISANPDVSIRTRTPENVVAEMDFVARNSGATAFRFVDDLFLTSVPFMKRCLPFFKQQGVGRRYVWDATGRINVLSAASDGLLDLMKEAGCREVALGIESGSERLLKYMGKHITPAMTLRAVKALTSRGINVKGYFILGFPTETRDELEATVSHIQTLWEATAGMPGTFRCSVFEFRPYPGTPEWHRLLATGKYTAEQLLLYEQVDLTDNGALREMLERDEFNFSVNLQFGDVPVQLVRDHLTHITTQQKKRLPAVRDHVQRASFN